MVRALGSILTVIPSPLNGALGDISSIQFHPMIRFLSSMIREHYFTIFVGLAFLSQIIRAVRKYLPIRVHSTPSSSSIHTRAKDNLL
ncbi:hypothetical protein DFJ43DRAFT_1103707, partial [Lentinula guzmanii]